MKENQYYQLYSAIKESGYSNNPESDPDIQRIKTSQYGGKSLRYEPKLKRVLINEFKELHKKVIP